MWRAEWSWASKPLGQPWQSLGLGLVALLLLAASAYFVHDTSRFLSSAQVASGTVVDLVVRQGVGFYPVFAWVDEAGKAHEKVSHSASNPPQFNKGQSVRVYYSMSDVEDARIDDFLDLWFSAVVTGVLGVVFAAFSIIVWKFRKGFYALAGYPELSGADAPTPKHKRRR